MEKSIKSPQSADPATGVPGKPAAYGAAHGATHGATPGAVHGTAGNASAHASVLRIDHLTVHRRQSGGADRAVLRDVSMAVAAGEVVMLIGPNGAGKSTLLAAVSGDLAAASGNIEFDGKPLSSWHRKTLARRRAVLPQRAGLSLPFTVDEVIRLGCLARTGSQATLARVVDDAARAAGVDHLAGRTMTQLSGGEQARVQLARVLAQIWPESETTEPTRNLLLLDEPCASLDPHHQHAVCTVVRDFAHRTGTGVVITMHDMNLAGQYGDRVVALSDGAVAADGPPQDVLTRTFVQTCFAVDAARLEADGGLLVATRPWAG